MNAPRRLARAAGLALAFLPSLTVAANCGSEPPGFGSAAAFQSWRSWCSCMGGTPPATFNQAQREGCPIRAAAGGGASGDSIGTLLGTAAGKALGEALFGNPEADAQGAAQAARAAELAAAEHRVREIAASERAAALLGEMLDVAPPPSAAPGAADNALGMMLGDAPVPRTAPGPADSDSFMPNRRLPPAVRNEPRAVVRQPATPAPGASLLEQLLPDTPPAAPPRQVAAQTPPIDSFSKGFEHGSGCYSQNAGPTCSGAAPGQFDTCLANYRAGFDAGARAMNSEIDTAYRAGQRARAAGELNNGASQPGAVGTCRIEWIKAYTSGYTGAPHP